MKQLLLICAVVALVGCGKPPEEAIAPQGYEKGPPLPEPPKAVPVNIANPIVEAAIRKAAKKPTGELTKADYEKVTKLWLPGKQLTSVKGVEKLTQLRDLTLINNRLTDVKGLKNLTQLKELELRYTPDLTKAQIDELQKALPNCIIYSNPTK